MEKMAAGKFGSAFSEKPPAAPSAEKDKFSYTRFIGDSTLMEKTAKKLQSTPSSTTSKSIKEGSSMSPGEAMFPDDKENQ